MANLRGIGAYQPLRGSHVVGDLDDRRVGVERGPRGRPSIVEVVDVPWQIGTGNERKNGARGRADAVQRDDVARKLIAYEAADSVRPGRHRVVNRDAERAEITSLEPVRRYGDHGRALAHAGVEHTKAGEEERLVLLDRTAERKAPFMLLERSLRLLEVGLGIE